MPALAQQMFKFTSVVCLLKGRKKDEVYVHKENYARNNDNEEEKKQKHITRRKEGKKEEEVNK